MKQLIIIVLLIGLGIGAFSTLINAGENQAEGKPMVQVTDPAATKYPNGAKIYKEKCVVCHQATGEGIPGAFPPLKNSDYLLKDKVRAVKQVLNGSQEEMIVNGVKYTAPMPPQVDSHNDAVDVINYVLNAWGNKGGTVTLEQVKHIKIVR